MTQTEWLVDWHECVISGEQNKYDLLKYAAVVGARDDRMPPNQLKMLRNKFVTDHVRRKKFPLNYECFLCARNKEDYKTFLVRHHILSLKNWGSNRRINIVTLCNFCHKRIHPWLSTNYLEWRT